MKHEGYPLPWCDARDEPYWAISRRWCDEREGWREFQSGKTMAEIIPEIDRIVAEEEAVAA